MKEYGFIDVYLVDVWNVSEFEVRVKCKVLYIMLSYKMVDICVVEFEFLMVYFYFSYYGESEIELLMNKKVVIIGSGLICIG